MTVEGSDVLFHDSGQESQESRLARKRELDALEERQRLRAEAEGRSLTPEQRMPAVLNKGHVAPLLGDSAEIKPLSLF